MTCPRNMNSNGICILGFRYSWWHSRNHNSPEQKISAKTQGYKNVVCVAVNPYLTIFLGLDAHCGRKLITYTHDLHTISLSLQMCTIFMHFLSTFKHIISRNLEVISIFIACMLAFTDKLRLHSLRSGVSALGSGGWCFDEGSHIFSLHT